MTEDPIPQREHQPAKAAIPDRQRRPVHSHWRRGMPAWPWPAATRRSADATAKAGVRAPADPEDAPPTGCWSPKMIPARPCSPRASLRGAGIDARAVRAAADVIAEMETFRPDLVHDGLAHAGDQRHGADCTDPRTRGLRRCSHRVLTGDPDPERQFQALEIGADDFLSKPIRPRHLIAAVQKPHQARARDAQAPAGRRVRAQSRHRTAQRPHLLQAIAAAIAADDIGGTLLVEIQNAGALAIATGTRLRAIDEPRRPPRG